MLACLLNHRIFFKVRKLVGELEKLLLRILQQQQKIRGLEYPYSRASIGLALSMDASIPCGNDGSTLIVL